MIDDPMSHEGVSVADEAELKARLDGIADRLRKVGDRASELERERVALEDGLAELSFEAVDDPTKAKELGKRRSRRSAIRLEIDEMSAAAAVGETQAKAARAELDRIRRLARIEQAKRQIQGLASLGDALDLSAAAFGRDYARARRAWDHAVRVVLGTFPNPMQAMDFLAGGDDGGRFASVAKIYVERHGGPKTDDDTGVPGMAASRADAPAPSAMVRDRSGHLMSILEDLAVKAMSPEPEMQEPAQAAPIVARDDVHRLVLGPGPQEREPEIANVLPWPMPGAAMPVFPRPAEFAPAAPEAAGDDDEAARAARADAFAAAQPETRPVALSPDAVAALVAVKGAKR